MKISKLFGLNKTQYELDFVDVDIDTDIPLFLDPYFISKMDFEFAAVAYNTMHNYFVYLLSLLQTNNFEKSREIFSHLGEANELCLGLSKGKPSGRGMGPTDTEKIFNNLLKSKAYETGLMEDIEDFRIFVPNVDKDKVSDMTANIIKWHLITYTQDQCNLWGIPLTPNVPSGYFWDDVNNQWDNKYTDMLVSDDRKIILVPKRIVCYSNAYTDKKYMQHFALNYLQDENLRLGTSLVKEHKDKTKYVTKKDIVTNEELTHKIDKKWLKDFTIKNHDVFEEFKKYAIANETILTNNELDSTDINEITMYLINKIKHIPEGVEGATEYHRTIAGTLELLFYPNIGNPRIEDKLHGDRKRIDITFDNYAETGFFKRLNDDIPCRFIIVECKNYKKDIANPELDQLSGRFSNNRGKFGISTCRHIDEMNLFLERCADTYKDGRGLIIPLTDDDFINMLNEFPTKGTDYCEQILQDRFHNIAFR